MISTLIFKLIFIKVWNSCTRESRRRNYRRTDNLSNRALGDGQREDQVQLDPK